MSRGCFKIVQEWVSAGEWGNMVLTMTQSLRVLGDRHRRGDDMSFYVYVCPFPLLKIAFQNPLSVVSEAPAFLLFRGCNSY